MAETQNVAVWLLEAGPAALSYRVLTELLGRPETDAEAVTAKAGIAGSEPVQELLSAMHPEGYWLQRNYRTKALVGAGVEYDSFATTHFVLSYLSELGMDRSHPQVAMAAERYLSLQKPDGDWWMGMSCHQGYNLRTFLRLGYRQDPRVQRTLDLLLETQRPDGGYLCDMHEGKYKTRPVKSCYRGAVKVLLAFSELPEVWQEPRCRELVAYFMRRGGIFRSTAPGIPVNKDMERISFPITWRANSFEVLYALSKMGLGQDERLAAAWQRLESRAGPDGSFPLDWTPAQSPWKVGRRGEPNPWVTFYICCARKMRDRPEPAAYRLV